MPCSFGVFFCKLETDKPDTANLIFRNPYSRERPTNRTTLEARGPTDSSSEPRIATFALANVKDEPRPRLARAVLLGARIVTAVVVGSGALFGFLDSRGQTSRSIDPAIASPMPIKNAHINHGNLDEASFHPKIGRIRLRTPLIRLNEKPHTTTPSHATTTQIAPM